MEKVSVISASYQPNADKPILYPIEIPKYTDVTVKLKRFFCVGGPTAPSKLRAKFSGKVKILEMILSALSKIVPLRMCSFLAVVHLNFSGDFVLYSEPI